MGKLSSAALSIALFSLIFSVVFWFTALPQLKELHQNFDAMDQRQKQAMVPLAKKSPVLSSVSKTQADLATALLPSDTGQYDLTIQVESLAKTDNLTVSALTIGGTEASSAPKTVQAQQMGASTAPAAASAGLKKVPITIAATASYDNIMRFVNGLTQLDRFVEINQVNVSSGSTDAATALQLTATAYYLP